MTQWVLSNSCNRVIFQLMATAGAMGDEKVRSRASGQTLRHSSVKGQIAASAITRTQLVSVSIVNKWQVESKKEWGDASMGKSTQTPASSSFSNHLAHAVDNVSRSLSPN